ncbi:MAG: transposase, partial [Deltaproteobacteria bacterium]
MGQKGKPKIQPTKLEKDSNNQKEKRFSGKRPGSHKRSKTANLTIQETIPIPPEWIPPGSVLKGYQPFTVQGIEIKIINHRHIKIATEG